MKVDDYTALIWRNSFRWNADHAKGTPIVVSYSFGKFESSWGYKKMPYSDRDGIRDALDEFERWSGLIFVETTRKDSDVIFYSGNRSWSSAGNSGVPNQTNGEFRQEVVVIRNLATKRYPENEPIEKGREFFGTALHEIGHVVGLKHPHERSPRLINALDNSDHTVMSYNRLDIRKKLKELDIDAISEIYGDRQKGVEAEYSADDRIIIVAGTRRDEIIASPGESMRLLGRGGDDILFGAGARDDIRGGRGDDTLRGGDGNDQLTGGPGADLLAGEGGRDLLKGGGGSDTIFAGTDNKDYIVDKSSTLLGGSGGDQLFGSTKNDFLEGGKGADTLMGGQGDDRISGGAGDDYLAGQGGKDELFGGDGADTLEGGAGRNALFGGDGDDRLIFSSSGTANGGQGADLIEIIAGNVMIVFEPGDGIDQIVGFNANDTIDLSGFAELGSAEDVHAAFEPFESGVRLLLGADILHFADLTVPPGTDQIAV